MNGPGDSTAACGGAPRGGDVVKVLVLYHSTRGHTELMAYAAADGACRSGVEVEVKRVPELLTREAAHAAGYKLDQPAPIAAPSELQDYHGILIGTGARQGRMGAEMAHFLERAGGFHPRGALRGRVGGAFTSAAAPHGGQETTLLSIIASLLHFGMVVVGLDHGFAARQNLAASDVGTPFGASTITALDRSYRPSQIALDGARYQGGRVADTALALHGG